MNVKFFAKFISVAGLSFLLTACSLFGSSSAGKSKSKTDQGGQKAQSSPGKASIIDQELKKQYDIYKEIIQYQMEQDKKVIKQSEERFKKLKEESNKPAKTEKAEGKKQSKDTSSKSSNKQTEGKGGQSGSTSKT
ncbi:hypothetical protein ACFQZT_13045 [Paenibacillus sp. GCM10027628]|uniref:hypothetical protein n=1 Tax=Paenibacillus sp. GCM10027628 TaxID=3273413 RepID=UPI003644CD59